MADCDHFIAGAAMIGGISYFHAYAYDLLATNERIMAATFDAAIAAHRKTGCRRSPPVLVDGLRERRRVALPRGPAAADPAAAASYGFQKLAVEYFARAAWEQYQLPYTIVRPFNCVGIGERRALGDEEILSGNVKLAMSHVVPDLVQKVLKGQDPLHILGDGNQVRHYTYGGDLATGIVTAMEHPEALNEDFNLSTAQSRPRSSSWPRPSGGRSRATSVPLPLVHDEPFEYDVQRRVPDVEKAKRVLGFEATTSLDDMLDEVIPWIEAAIKAGTI